MTSNDEAPEVTGAKGDVAERILDVFLLCARTVLVGASLFLIVLSFQYGIDRGHHGMVAYHSHGPFWDAICGILSVEKYNSGRYACVASAREQQSRFGLDYDDAALQKYGKPLREMVRDTAYLDGQIAKLFAEPPVNVPSGFRGIGWGADAGYMDFMQLSFSLFGKKVSSIYFTFYLLLAASAFLFILQHWSRVFALSVLFCFAYVLYGFLTLGNVDTWGVEFVTNPRFLTTVGIIPFLHVFLLILYREKLTPRALVLISPQLALTVLAFDARTTAYWAPLALATYAVSLVSIPALRRREIGGAVARGWPATMAVAAAISGSLLIVMLADSRLSGQGYTRHHSIWSAVYYTLQYHPEWKQKYAKQHEFLVGDGPAVSALNSYLRRHDITPKWNPEVYTADGSLRDEKRDKYLRAAFFEFFRNDPRFVIEVIPIGNAKLIFRLMRGLSLQLWGGMGWGIVALGLLAGLALCIDVFRRKESLITVGLGAILLLVASAIAASPNWITVVIENSMTDATFVNATGLLALGLVVVVWLLKAILLRFRTISSDWH